MADEESLMKLLAADPRYQLEAYVFVRKSLQYAQEVMGFGDPSDDESSDDDDTGERHVTASQLCEAARQYALNEYGLMSRLVLKRWGITSTSDFGEIVYNMIKIQFMKKSERDRREDFNNLFEFSEAFDESFEITLPNDRKSN